MKKSDCNRGHTCRLLTLFVLIAVGSDAFQVNGASIPRDKPTISNFSFIKGQNNRNEGVTTQLRTHSLHNKCSNRKVQIFKKGRQGIKANGKNMEFTVLYFESTQSRTIKIYGKDTHYYICFNRRGKLLARKNGKGKRCEFYEEYSSDRTTFQYRSADPNHRWYMGFKKNGKPIAGFKKERLAKNDRKQECFQFQKPHSSKCSNKIGPSDVNFCHFWNPPKKPGMRKIPKERSLRHEKNHKRRRKG